ncbi:MAG TPA: HEAT repeat domain-containing protein [Myxococcales bacterium LLY-WYZ-16_1]|nr:HEAT repeat domain-containing protein [Myxococcales bacterium LLY-WYZ-16_1]
MSPGERLRSALGLERGDLRRVLPLTGAYAAILTTLYVLKPARNALFLDQLGFERLPWVLILVAAVGGLFAVTYGRYAGALRTDRLVWWTLVAMGAVLIGFRGLLGLDAPWVYFVFFVWVQLFGLVATSLLWLWANAAFDARQARRLFGFIGTGGIAGAIAGGLLTGWIAPWIGTRNLLWLAAAGVGIVVLCLRWAPAIRAPQRVREPARSSESNGSLARLLAIKAGLVALVAVWVDLQFNLLVDEAFADTESKAAFFGRFFAGLSAFSLLFQLFVTPWLLSRFGVGVALSVLPLALGVGAFAGAASGSFATGLMPKAADGGFRHSVHKSAQEVLFVPLAPGTKRRTKLFIDTTIDTAFTGLGAAWVLLLTGPLGWSYGGLTTWVMLGVTAVLAVIASLRHAYVEAFRHAIEGRRIDLDELTTELREAGGWTAVEGALKSPNPRQILYGLELLGGPVVGRPAAAVRALLKHDAEEVRAKALGVLGAQPEALAPETLEPMLQDPSEQVRLEAWCVWCRRHDRAAAAELAKHLDPSDPELAFTLRVARHLPQDTLRSLLDAQPERLLPAARTDDDVAAALAGALAASRDPRHRPLLERLLVDASHPVAAAAIEGIAASSDARFVPWLVDRLEDRRVMGSARRALVQIAGAAVSALAAKLVDREASLRARRAAGRALTEIGTEDGLSALLSVFADLEPMLQGEMLQQLVRLRQRTGLRVPRRFAHRELQRRVEFLRVLDRTDRELSPALRSPHASPAVRLFGQMVREKREQLLDELFHVLALRHSVDEMADARRNLRHSDRSRRADALEFLDNVLSRRERRWVMPALEGSRRGAEGLPLRLEWLRVPDPWFRACAVFAHRDLMARPPDPAWAEDPHPLVQDARAAAPAAAERTAAS